MICFKLWIADSSKQQSITQEFFLLGQYLLQSLPGDSHKHLLIYEKVEKKMCQYLLYMAITVGVGFLSEFIIHSHGGGEIMGLTLLYKAAAAYWGLQTFVSAQLSIPFFSSCGFAEDPVWPKLHPSDRWTRIFTLDYFGKQRISRSN